jgi:hypothetical protein
VHVREARDDERDWLRATLEERWGDEIMVGHGRVWTLHELPAMVAIDDSGERVGVATYDNLAALRSYQRNGFRLSELRPGAVDEARATLKPSIPETGNDGIPLRDEIDLVLELGASRDQATASERQPRVAFDKSRVMELRRWKSTGRGLRKSCTATSRFDSGLPST